MLRLCLADAISRELACDVRRGWKPEKPSYGHHGLGALASVVNGRRNLCGERSPPLFL
jgi:hypothetical protein